MIGVLTGDLVHSMKMDPTTYHDTLVCLKRLLKSAQLQCHAVGEIYRGDGFQIEYPHPVQALESALAIKLALHAAEFSKKPVQCTLSLAFGPGQADYGSPGAAMGPAFVASGRGLENTSRGELTLHFCDQPMTEPFQLLTRFLNHQLNGLTKSQASLLSQYLASGFAEHKEIARITGTSRQNISNRLASMGAFLIRDYIRLINQRVEELGGES